MHSSNRYLFSSNNKDLGLSDQRPLPHTQQSKISESMDVSLSALFNMSCNKIDTIMSSNNQPPISQRVPPKIPQTGNQSNPRSNTIVLDDDRGPSLEMLTAGQNIKKDANIGSFIVLQGQNLLFEDVDFWLIFDNTQVNMSVSNLMEQLKNQFESINIVKVKQAYYLNKQKEGTSAVTGWKLFDKISANEIIGRTKELMFYINNNKLKYEVIGSTQELRKYLLKHELDQRLNQVDLFKDEYVVPLLKLQIQGLFYYEFDYADICPETICVLCGQPANINNAKLKEYLNENELPEPLNILRNPSEGETCVRLTFQNKNDADTLRFKGFRVPLKGPFPEKPLIIMTIKDRGFDYFSQLVKYQVMVDFEANEDHTTQTKIEVLRKIQSNYGLVSDVNILYSELWVVTFVQFESATRCMDQWQFDQFGLKLTFSKPTTSYMLAGYLFQIDAPMTRATNTPTRPPPLLRVDPSQLKIKSECFERNPNLKRRYQKVYLRQKENLAKEGNQGAIEFYNNDAKEKVDTLSIESKLLEYHPSKQPPTMLIEDLKTQEKSMEGDRKVIVEDDDEEIPITIHGEITKESPASKNTKQNKRKSSAPKKKTNLQKGKKGFEKENEDDSLNGKRKLSPREASLESEPRTIKIVHNNDAIPRMVSPPNWNSFAGPMRARKTVVKSRDDILEERKMREEVPVEAPKYQKYSKDKDENNMKEKNKTKDKDVFIQKNIEKIKSLIQSHRDLQKKKNIDDIQIKEEEEEQGQKQEMDVEKPKSGKDEKIITKQKKGPRTKK